MSTIRARLSGIAPGTLILGVVAALVAAWVFDVTTIGVQYVLGWTMDPLENPIILIAPGVVLATIAYGFVALLAHASRRWLLPLAGLWAGFLGAFVVGFAFGGPQFRDGAMRLELGSPVATSVELGAICRTAPGKPGTVVLVIPTSGAPSVRLANEATGEAVGRRGAETAQFVATEGPSGREPLEIPGLPPRPPIRVVSAATMMSDLANDDRIVHLGSMSFLASYSYGFGSLTNRGSSGSATFRAVRGYMPFAENELMPNDPWPPTYDLTVRWTCDMESSLPAPITTHRPGVVPASPRTPPPSGPTVTGRPTPAAPSLAPGSALVDVRIATTSARADVFVSGARLAEFEPARVEAGAMTTGPTGGRLTVMAIGVPRVVRATFRVVVSDITAGSIVDLGLATVGESRTEVTVFNLAGEPVPVFTAGGTGDDWMRPMRLAGTWLLDPVSVREGW